MNALELQAIRHIFAMTVEESAMYISCDNNVVAWQQWENGDGRKIMGMQYCSSPLQHN